MTTQELEVDQGTQVVDPEVAVAQPEIVGEDRPTPPEPEVVKEEQEEIKEDVIDTIVPRADVRTVHLEYAGTDRDYVQKPLTYFRKMEFFGLVGDTLEGILRDGTVSLNDLIGGIDGLSLSNVDIDSFVTTAAKVAHYAPDFIKDCYLIWLNVPKEELRWASEALDSIPDEEGIIILETFIDQNWDVIEDFFTKEVPKLFRRIQDRRNKS